MAKGDQMNGAQFEEFLVEALEGYADILEREGFSVRTFREDGVLTGNRGVVVRCGGVEFAVTIARRT